MPSDRDERNRAYAAVNITPMWVRLEGRRMLVAVDIIDLLDSATKVSNS